MTDHDEELAALRAEYEARLEWLDLYYQKQIDVLRAYEADVRRERDDTRATLAKQRGLNDSLAAQIERLEAEVADGLRRLQAAHKELGRGD